MFTTTENLLPNVIRRKKRRVRPYAIIVGVDVILRKLSFFDIENSSNRASWFLSKIEDEKLLYMGPSDIRYLIWVIAAIKTGKCVVFPSLANQVPANQRLIETVGAKTLLYAPEASVVLDPLLVATREYVEHVPTPTYAELLHEDISPTYQFEKSFDDIKSTNFMGLHTSGTSGNPKPIYWNHSALATLSSFLDTSITDQHGSGENLTLDLYQGTNIFIPFPLSHFGGIASSLASIYCENTVVLPAPGTQLTPENCTLILQHGECTASASPPSILESMLSYSPGVDALARLKHVAYAGGPLNPIRGEALAKKLPHLFSLLASTEGGIGRFVSSGNSSRWNSFKFLVYPRTELINRTHAFFHTHPHIEEEFRTSDLFSPIDDKNEWWIYRGRADNWIAMSNGLKMDPTEMENKIASHPDVTGVIVAGSHRFRLCLLLELKEGADDRSLETIWPVIEDANMEVPKFGRVPKELVLVATPDKPFLRAGKGTIQRRLTIQVYEEEISRRYDEVEDGLLTSGISLPLSIEPQDLTPFLREVCSQSLLDNDEVSTINVDESLFTFGLDSLSAFVLLARLKAALRKYGVEEQKLQLVNNKLLYTSPTIRQLAETLSKVLAMSEHSSGAVEHNIDDLTIHLLEKYDAELKGFVKHKVVQIGESNNNPKVVVLTGSTGSLGSHILSSLLARSDVKKVFCLNRNGDTRKQSASLKSQGLPSSLVDDERVVILQARLAEPKLGLSKEDYNSLLRETTTIIHNAFPVNFLLGLQSFEPQFQSLLNLLRLATDSQHSSAVLFISSITAAIPAVGNTQEQTIPEAVLDTEQARALLHQGYARAKYVCERLLASYTTAAGQTAAVLRVGQVCGPSSGNGVWNISEWVPSLVLSSKFLGAAPDSLGSLEINWVPIDKLGRIVTEIVGITPSRDDPTGFQVYNIVNPSITCWGKLLPTIVKVGPLAIVSVSEWVEKLEKSEGGHHMLHQNPAVKLIDFYKQTMLADESELAKVEMGNLLRVSETAANLQPIDESDMARWMRGWGL
ncbi:uncharacterized protein F4807DRAFT_469221 [Annulohypoxylon truncatum]|uniref:uncharacterized protein n=1 Tax=Annulohypoxylon truncatum TaxID=327061 RepID=UPI0020073830|nr:uncharacterized protein F4807DRAFT_469221 [Annulohypoxylon truncatum]KAI1207713.1 hypothetical protein F4807DRAFT_469221 [Annulohypoxylon truncatum]